MKNAYFFFLLFSFVWCFTPPAHSQDSCNVYIWQDTLIDPINGLYLETVPVGTPPFTYQWSTGDTTSFIYTFEAVEHCVTLTDATGCVAVDCELAVIFWLDCEVYISQQGTGNGTFLQANAYGGNPPYQYFWSTGDTTQQITPDSTGEYCVYTIDADSCISAESCWFFQDYIPDSCFTYISALPSSQGGEDLCAYPSGPGPYTFLWSTGETEWLINVQQPGNYCVTVTDGNGCESSSCFFYSGTTPSDSCIGWIYHAIVPGVGIDLSAISLGTAPYTYLWSTGDTSMMIQAQQEGTYCVTITDADGCSAYPCFYFDGNNGSQDSCFASINELPNSQGGVDLCAYSNNIGPYTYLWSTGETTWLINVQQAGNYCVTVTDGLGCVAIACYYYAGGSNVDSCSVMIAGDSLGLSDGIIWAEASGVAPYTYLWNTGETTQFVTITDEGPYCVTITDNLGCVAENCVWGYPPFTDSCSVAILDSIVGNDTYLFVDALSNGSTPISFLWSSGQTTPIIQVSNPGLYCVTVTYADGCQASDCFDLNGIPSTNNICGFVFLADSLKMLGSTTVSLFLLENGGTTLIAEQYFQGEAYFWEYNFDNLPDGDYIVRAEIDAGATGSADYVPTYHLDAVLWNEADVINLPSDLPFCQGVIILQPDGGESDNGNGYLAGNVHDENGALEGITILLYDEFGNLLDYVYSDENGAYMFGDLPLGTYQVVIEYPGFNHAEYWVTLTDDNSGITGLNFEVSGGAIVTGLTELNIDAQLQLYPNPVVDFVQIQMDESWEDAVEITIFNVAGKRVYQSYNNTGAKVVELNISQLNSGMYLYQVTDGKQTATGKLIKQ